MRKRSLLFLSLLVPAFLVLGGYAALKAQQKPSTPSPKRWSDAATWPDKKVPGKDAAVTIDKDMNVVLDVSTPELRSLTGNWSPLTWRSASESRRLLPQLNTSRDACPMRRKS